MLPLELPMSEIELLYADAEAGLELAIDLENQQVVRPNGQAPIKFEIDPFRRHCLLNGLDDIALTLQHADLIDKFDEKRTQIWPWLDGESWQGKKVVPVKKTGKGMEW